ncbi:MAG: hypothetical protein HGA71_08450 [Azonexaceae bacterium]|jgi:hypothetical protein|nr:hypothetical protein [Azonexaceae bacterium]
MINLPLETEKQGLSVDSLVVKLIEETGDTEQNVMSRLVAWERKGLIVIHQERDADGELRFYAWKRDPEVVKAEKRSVWLSNIIALGGFEKTIFGDVPQEKVYEAVVGKGYKAVMREIKKGVGIVRDVVAEVVEVVTEVAEAIAPVVAKVVSKPLSALKNWLGFAAMPVPALAVVRIDHYQAGNNSPIRRGIP